MVRDWVGGAGFERTFELRQGSEDMTSGYVPDIHITFFVSCDKIIPLIHNTHRVYWTFVVSCKPPVGW